MTAAPKPRDSILLESGTNEVEFIEFRLGEVSYGINVSKVQRVLALTSATINAVAQAAPCVLGMIHIQGRPVVLMDLKIALNISFDSATIDPARQLILVTTFNQTTTAFLIDGISKIHRASWNDFEPMSERVSGDGAAGFATGTVTLDENIIIILDLERLMLNFFPVSHAHASTLSATAERSGRESISIVYAEDSRMVRQLTENIIRQAGYTQLRSFENGATALAYLQHCADLAASEGGTLADAVQLVLTDIEMPKLDGLALCRQIKQSLCPIDPPKVIVYSSLINNEMAAKCRSVGADAQLAKPEVAMIVELIDTLCL